MNSIVSPLEDFNIPPFDLPSQEDDTTFPLFLVDNQEVLLRNLLGDLLYEAFDEAITNMPLPWDAETAYTVGLTVTAGNNIYSALSDSTGIPVTNDAVWALTEENNRWLALLNGTTFLYNNRMYKWKGCKSMLIGWHIAKWLEYQNDAQTSIGTVLPEAENSVVTSPVYRIKRGYNSASYLSKNLLSYIYYSDQLYYDVVQEEYSNIGSYITSKFKPLGKVNEFDL